MKIVENSSSFFFPIRYNHKHTKETNQKEQDNMNTMTQDKFISEIRGHKGCEIATIQTETIPKLLVAGKCLGSIRKRSKMNVLIGFDYENSVNNQLGREDTEMEFIAKPRKWGKRVDLKTVEHKGNTYLTIQSLKCYDMEYVDSQGDTIPDEIVKPFLPKKSASRQGTSKEIVYRDFKVESIKEITFRGHTVTVY